MTQRRATQSGNAFTMVLIGVVLFGALAFSFTRSGRQGMSNVSTQEAGIAAGDVMAYARNIEQGINRLRVKGVSESDIDFNGAGAGYDNTDCSTPKCEIFNPAGGQQVWQNTVTNANDGSDWLFTGAVSVDGLAQDNGTARSSELIMALPNMDVSVCREINRKLGIDNPADSPPSTSSGVSFTTKYAGTFTVGDSIGGTELDGKSAACFEDGGAYFFYQVLLAR